ncbi:MAG: hypothetical protein WC068_16025 [Caulobacter sp.]
MTRWSRLLLLTPLPLVVAAAAAGALLELPPRAAMALWLAVAALSAGLVALGRRLMR